MSWNPRDSGNNLDSAVPRDRTLGREMYESYIMETYEYLLHLADAEGTLEGLDYNKSRASTAVDTCLAAATDSRLTGAIATMWNDHLGALLTATVHRAVNGTSAARRVAECVMEADAVAAEYADNAEETMFGVSGDPRIVDARQGAEEAAARSDVWIPEWREVPDAERKG